MVTSVWAISDDKPVMIMAIDSERKIREVLPEIRGMVKEGLVVLLDAEVVEPLVEPLVEPTDEATS